MPTPRKLFRLRILLSLSLVYGFTAQACAPGPNSAITQPASGIRILSAQEIDQVKNSGLVEANNRFSWQLFNRIYQADPARNQFVSPLSAALALQMTLQGANGETASQMKQALGLDQLSDAQLQTALPLLLRKLQRPAEDITLEIANSLWANQSVSFEPDFIKRVSGTFGAKVSNVDMASAATVKQINDWASQTTHGKIPQILDQIDDPNTIAYLINAIYFKANWSDPFEKDETSDKPFTLNDGSQKQVKMMRRFGHYQYLPPSDDFPYQAVALPYGKNKTLAMYAFLPTTGKTLADLQADLQKQDFNNLHSRFFREGGSVQLPKFELGWKRRLNNDLKALGMTDAFSPSQADFGKMVVSAKPGDIFISFVDQFTHVDVNEEGTTAAAVTIVEAVPASSEPLKTLDILFDHPFVFMIRDEETGQILFMGSITDPTQTKVQ